MIPRNGSWVIKVRIALSSKYTAMAHMTAMVPMTWQYTIDTDMVSSSNTPSSPVKELPTRLPLYRREEGRWVG